jgi:predicted transglutaminase-like cysteine proteinase
MGGSFRRHGTACAAVIALAILCVSVTSTNARPATKIKPRKMDETTLSLRSPILDMHLPLEVPVRSSTNRLARVEPPAGARFFTINQVLAKQAGLPARRLAAAVVADDLASDAASPNPVLPPVSDEPFGLFAFRAPEGALWTKWRALSTRLSGEADALARCRADVATCSPATLQFLAVVSGAATHEGRARIAMVNHAVNASVRYTADFAQHGVADRWSAPIETFASGRGDCEDYAIAKFVALREAGMAATDLRLLLVRDLVSRQDHAVLAARQDGHWLVLDNRWDGLSGSAATARFMPLFALDDDGVKLFAAPYAVRPVHESEADITPASDDATIGGAMLTTLL